MIREMWRDGWEARLILILLIVTLLACIWAVYASHEDKKEWEKFATSHKCKKVGEMSASTQTGVGVGMLPNGQVGTVITTTTTAGKTGWLCDDGVTYWR